MRLFIKAIFFVFLAAQSFAAPVRIKDLVEFDGVRGNDLIGYGLVVGLDGSGDSLRNVPLTEELLISLVERLGVNISAEALRSKNVAAVIVTAELPAFARSGSRINASISTIGDARSLLGGTLVMTPLKAADGDIYAVAQGSIISGGTAVYGDAARVVQGVPTAGVIPGGARVEREVDFEFEGLEVLRLALRNSDFTTASRIEAAINRNFGRQIAKMQDSGTVIIDHRVVSSSSISSIVSQIENLEVLPEAKAKVVIDHRSGTVVMNERVKISRVGVSQGGTVITVAETPEISQPNPFSNGSTAVSPRTTIGVQREEEVGVALIEDSASLEDLVSGMNALGVRTAEIIDLLKSIHAAGALHAEIVVY